VTAAVPKRLTDDRKPGFAEPFANIDREMFSTNLRRVSTEIIFFIDFPPRIEYSARRRRS
jgi:hypothetical protein